MDDSKFIRINDAVYIKDKSKKYIPIHPGCNYVSVCLGCQAKDICKEPDKDRRLTCSDKKFNEMIAQVKLLEELLEEESHEDY